MLPAVYERAVQAEDINAPSHAKKKNTTNRHRIIMWILIEFTEDPSRTAGIFHLVLYNFSVM